MACGLTGEGDTVSTEMTLPQLIGQMCIAHGSSMEGRREAFRSLTGYRNKIPVLVSERTQYILFPTLSPVHPDCLWVSCNDILDITPAEDGESQVTFLNGRRRKVPFQTRLLRKQMRRCEEFLAALDRQNEEESVVYERELIRSLLQEDAQE